MDLAAPLRETFLRRFTIEQHIAAMAEAFRRRGMNSIYDLRFTIYDFASHRARRVNRIS